MSTEILYIEERNGKLILTIKDPTRAISKVPGLLRVTNVRLSNQLRKGNDDSTKERNLNADLSRPMRIVGSSTYGDLVKVSIENPLNDIRSAWLFDDFFSAKVNRLGGTTPPPPPAPPPPPPTGNGNKDDEAATGFKFNPIYLGGALLIALMALLYFKSK